LGQLDGPCGTPRNACAEGVEHTELRQVVRDPDVRIAGREAGPAWHDSPVSTDISTAIWNRANMAAGGAYAKGRRYGAVISTGLSQHDHERWHRPRVRCPWERRRSRVRSGRWCQQRRWTGCLRSVRAGASSRSPGWSSAPIPTRPQPAVAKPALRGHPRLRHVGGWRRDRGPRRCGPADVRARRGRAARSRTADHPRLAPQHRQRDRPV
jgi:hypothetical protein